MLIGVPILGREILVALSMIVVLLVEVVPLLVEVVPLLVGVVPLLLEVFLLVAVAVAVAVVIPPEDSIVILCYVTFGIYLLGVIECYSSISQGADFLMMEQGSWDIWFADVTGTCGQWGYCNLATIVSHGIARV